MFALDCTPHLQQGREEFVRLIRRALALFEADLQQVHQAGHGCGSTGSIRRCLQQDFQKVFTQYMQHGVILVGSFGS